MTLLDRSDVSVDICHYGCNRQMGRTTCCLRDSAHAELARHLHGLHSCNSAGQFHFRARVLREYADDPAPGPGGMRTQISRRQRELMGVDWSDWQTVNNRVAIL